MAEVEQFFVLLKSADAEGAGAVVIHASSDWWPHQVRSLWQDLVIPWLEERGEEADLQDDKSWRDLSWLRRIGYHANAHWDKEGEEAADDEHFFVNVTYDGVVTDVSADFRVARGEDGWVLQREIIHVA